MQLLWTDLRKIDKAIELIGLPPFGITTKKTRKLLLYLYRSCLISGDDKVRITHRKWNGIPAAVKDKMISRKVIEKVNRNVYRIAFIEINDRKWNCSKRKVESPFRGKKIDIDKHKSYGTVYFIICHSFVKIGYTARNANERLIGLQIGSPYELMLWGTIDNVDESLEHKLHQRYSAFRVRGEWFEIEVLSQITKDIPITCISR